MNNFQKIRIVIKVYNTAEVMSIFQRLLNINYNPWENNYDKKPNNIKTPCSDLWRRFFVWWDGVANPCDVDYKSKLQVGNIKNKSIEDLWNSDYYNELRKNHLNKKRKSLRPCNACSLI